MSRIRISVQGIIDVEVESEELPFIDLKKEAMKLFKFAKSNIPNTEPYDNEIV